MDKIAVVVQRYGKEVNGGAELHARLLVEQLKELYEVEVITSCSLDYHIWDNHYPEGETEIDGVKVLRFMNENKNIDTHRRLSRYIRGHNKYYNTKYKFGNILSLSFRRFRYRKKKNYEEVFQRWIENNGPVSSKMMTYIEEEKDNYKAIIFFTYLFYPTYFGLQRAGNKSIFIPTAHDEPVFYYNCFKNLFSYPKFIMYNTESEKNLVEDTYPESKNVKSNIAGVGFEEPVLENCIERKIKTPYFVYIGRIDANKGCNDLVEFFSNINNPDLKLVMIGKNHLRTPITNDNIILTGFIDEDEKLHYLQHSEALIIPSRFESLSMVTLEAMYAGKPVLANGHCEVLKDHIDKSKAGLVYYDKDDFADKISRLLDLSDTEKQDISKKGKSYVEENFQWKSIVKKFVSAIDYISTLK